jgi:acyl-CoA reductase-like NAD-dependent aldehyde dehydrogenase
LASNGNFQFSKLKLVDTQTSRTKQETRSIDHVSMWTMKIRLSTAATSSSSLLRTSGLFSDCTATKRAQNHCYCGVLHPDFSNNNKGNNNTRIFTKDTTTYVPAATTTFHCYLTKRRMVQGVVIDDDGCLLDTNPATGEVIAKVPITTSPELEIVMQQAAHAASAPGSKWAKASVEERIDVIRLGLQELEKKKDDLAKLIVQEMGKPLQQAVDEMEGAVQKEEYLALLQETLQPQHVSRNCTILRQALGVVLVLSPWNFPVDEILLLALPALASGNAVVVKPSEVTPLCGQEVVQALQAALLAKNYDAHVIQCIQGDGPRVGTPAVAHPLVKLVAMTGSSATGKRVLQASVGSGHDDTTTTGSSSNSSVKRVILEMGGKDPMLVLDDANVEKAARDAVEFSLQNTGQVCCSLERIYVHESIYHDFSHAVVEQAKLYKIGNGMEPGVEVGPMVSLLQKRHVQNQVQDAMSKGATLLYQGDVPTETMSNYPDESNFYPVTVLSNVQDGMSIYRDETFGPVVCLIPFASKSSSKDNDGKDDEEAIRLANDSNYGLAAAVYSSNPERARRVASQIQAGAIGINTYSLAGHMHVSCPWVGHKESGFGFHSGKEGFLQFSTPKSLIVLPERDED